MDTSGEPYYVFDTGRRVEPDTYWCFREESKYGPYYFRLVRIQDGVAGLHAVIQDQWGYSTALAQMFDQEDLQQVTDGKELALVMLQLHT